MKQILLVFIGGGAGSALRFLIVRNSENWNYLLPGTFSVNVLGSLLMGFLLGLGMKQQLLSENTTLLLVTGFCGGFTTFSAFSYENQELLSTGDFLTFGVYTIASIFFGISGVFIGLFLARLF